LFQSLYSPGAGAVSSLLAAPEWCLWISALALVSIAGAAWTPLLLALPLLAAALGVTVLAAAVSAAQTRSVVRPVARHVRVRKWALTTLLHVVQPLARTRGRLAGHADHARCLPRRLAGPWPRVLTEWTDAWQSSERRLREIEDRLRTEGAVVSRGGVYDRWDLQARYGFAGAVRISLGIEEHGAGRQLVRLRLV